MPSDVIYHLAGPTGPAMLPDYFSFSSLNAIERCPRQWQLVHSRYGDRERFPARPSSALAEGDIVHQTLDHLFRTFSLHGLPPFGTPEFREASIRADIRRKIRNLVADHEARLARHPRGGGARLHIPDDQLANRAIRLFREVYPQAETPQPPFAARGPISSVSGPVPGGPALAHLLSAKGALSELPLTHPMLPFKGVLDLVWCNGDEVVVTDFKTGRPQSEHALQVGDYAILWWRCSGLPPSHMEVRYPGGVEAQRVDPTRLVDLETNLANRIHAARIALASIQGSAKPGEQCRWCDVRQFCDSYWATPGKEPTDVELRVVGTPTETGFPAQEENGELAVVFTADVGRAQGPFRTGERLRVVNARRDNRGIEVKSWTEVFHLDG
jgi:hypothetical protein